MDVITFKSLHCVWVALWGPKSWGWGLAALRFQEVPWITVQSAVGTFVCAAGSDTDLAVWAQAWGSSRCHKSHQHSPGKTQPHHKREISGKKKPQSKELLQTTHPVVQVAAGAFTPYFMQQIMWPLCSHRFLHPSYAGRFCFSRCQAPLSSLHPQTKWTWGLLPCHARQTEHVIFKMSVRGDLQSFWHVLREWSAIETHNFFLNNYWESSWRYYSCGCSLFAPGITN